jgi:hypothetical protein
MVGMMLQALCMTTRWEYAPLLIETLEGCGARVGGGGKKGAETGPISSSELERYGRPRALAKGAKFCHPSTIFAYSRLRSRPFRDEDELLELQAAAAALALREKHHQRAVSVRFWHLAAVSMECAQQGNRRNTRVSGAVNS